MALLFSSQSAWNKFRIILKLKPLKFKAVILYQCQTSLYTVISVFLVLPTSLTLKGSTMAGKMEVKED